MANAVSRSWLGPARSIKVAGRREEVQSRPNLRRQNTTIFLGATQGYDNSTFPYFSTTTPKTTTTPRDEKKGKDHNVCSPLSKHTTLRTPLFYRVIAFCRYSGCPTNWQHLAPFQCQKTKVVLRTWVGETRPNKATERSIAPTAVRKNVRQNVRNRCQ